MRVCRSFMGGPMPKLALFALLSLALSLDPVVSAQGQAPAQAPVQAPAQPQPSSPQTPPSLPAAAAPPLPDAPVPVSPASSAAHAPAPLPNPYKRFLDTTTPVPLTPEQKAHLAVRNLTNVFNLVTIVG